MVQIGPSNKYLIMIMSFIIMWLIHRVMKKLTREVALPWAMV